MPMWCTLWQGRHFQGHPQTSQLRMSSLQTVSCVSGKTGLLLPPMTVKAEQAAAMLCWDLGDHRRSCTMCTKPCSKFKPASYPCIIQHVQALLSQAKAEA